MSDESAAKPHSRSRYFVTGLLTVIPIWITWLLLKFLFDTVSAIGAPLA